MKRTKKLLALVLALMMAISCMAMPAMALENGAARSTMVCGACRSAQNFTYYVSDLKWRTITVGGCAVTNFTHKHTIYYRDHWYECDNCGHKINEYSVEDHVNCHYNG